MIWGLQVWRRNLVKTDTWMRCLLVVAAVLAAASGRAEAQGTAPDVPCEASIRSSPSFLWRGSSGQGYRDSSPPMWQEGMIRVAIEGGACSFALVMDPGAGSLSGGVGTLSMILSDRPDGFDLSSVSQDPLSSPLGGSGSSGDVSELPVYLSLPDGQIVGAGEYSAAVPVRLFVLEDGVARLVDEALIDVMASVGADLSVTALGFLGGSADVDLGDISQGFSRGFEFLVEGNAPASVTIESLNGGALVHSEAAVVIPYRAVFAGKSIDLAHGPQSSHIGLAPGRQERLRMELSGDPVEGPVAGNYSDTLTMVFRSDL